MKHSERDVAIVTGAGRSLGRAIAEQLHRDGYIVAVTDQDRQLAVEVANNLDATGATAKAYLLDVSSPGNVEIVFKAIADDFGVPRALVNNAGIYPDHAIVEMPVEAWDGVMAVNLRGPFLCTRAFGALMLARGRGSIVNIASIAAGKPNASPAYSVSKAGVLALTRHTAVEWGPRGVRANAVSPGFIRTPLSAVHYASDEMLQWRTGLVPVRRLGTTGDIADAAAYLASDAAGFVNGQDLIVDGGFLETPLMHAQPKADQYGGHGH